MKNGHFCCVCGAPWSYWSLYPLYHRCGWCYRRLKMDLTADIRGINPAKNVLYRK